MHQNIQTAQQLASNSSEANVIHACLPSCGIGNTSSAKCFGDNLVAETDTCLDKVERRDGRQWRATRTEYLDAWMIVDYRLHKRDKLLDPRRVRICRCS